ncbi:MAG: hypothetical protein ACP5N9_01490 [Candidatus Bilamarchaeum sp.]|jgi:rRNA maturation protein Rpf1
MITTSRYASKETKDEAKKIAQKRAEKYIARGKKTIEKIVESARRSGEHKVLILEEKNNKPLKLSILQIDELGRWKWISN